MSEAAHKVAGIYATREDAYAARTMILARWK